MPPWDDISVPSIVMDAGGLSRWIIDGKNEKNVLGMSLQFKGMVEPPFSIKLSTL
jgi:hypothetical protein